MKKILLVDDLEINLFLMRLILEKYNYETESVTSGKTR